MRKLLLLIHFSTTLHAERAAYMQTNFKHLIFTLTAILLMVSSANAGTYITHEPDVDMKQAFSEVLRKAKGGNAKAQLDLGRHYAYGEGVEQNDRQAFKWIEKAANQNLAIAKFDLAKFYLKGEGGVYKDIKKAEALLVQAAEQGVIEAHLVLGRMYTRSKDLKDYATASMWLKKAADKGSVEAMDQLALMFLDGRVIEPDHSKAAYWLQRGSDAGDPGATANLAHFYLEGTGVTKNLAKATSLLKEAAMKGHTYSIDYFVEQARKDNSEALQFLEQLHARQGHDTEAFKKYRQETKIKVPLLLR